jgi:hypothetical protein
MINPLPLLLQGLPYQLLPLLQPRPVLRGQSLRTTAPALHERCTRGPTHQSHCTAQPIPEVPPPWYTVTQRGTQPSHLPCRSNTEVHDWLELHSTHTMPLPAPTHSHTTTRATPQRQVRHERSTCTPLIPTVTNYSTPNMKSPNKVAVCRHTAGLPGPHPIPSPPIPHRNTLHESPNTPS